MIKIKPISVIWTIAICLYLTAQPLSFAKTFIVGITGGSASGKTTLAINLVDMLKASFADSQAESNAQSVCLLNQDWYIADWLQPQEYHLKEPAELAGFPHFDHPTAVDIPLMREHLIQLKNGLKIQAPIFDWTTKRRSDETLPVGPCSIVVFEGIHAFYDETILEQLNYKVFVDLASETRLERRLKRDVVERLRSEKQTLLIWEHMARPIYEKLIEPGKKYADLIVNTNKSKSEGLAETLELAKTIKSLADDFEKTWTRGHLNLSEAEYTKFIFDITNGQ